VQLAQLLKSLALFPEPEQLALLGWEIYLIGDFLEGHTSSEIRELRVENSEA
jgi:hypothetical protein